MVKGTHRVKIGPGLEEIIEPGMKPSTPEPKMGKSIRQLIAEGYDLLPADYNQYIVTLEKHADDVELAAMQANQQLAAKTLECETFQKAYETLGEFYKAEKQRAEQLENKIRELTTKPALYSRDCE